MVKVEDERAADYEYIAKLDGLFVGQLDEGEMAAFERLVKAHLARRSYEGGAGFLGLAKVRMTP